MAKDESKIYVIGLSNRLLGGGRFDWEFNVKALEDAINLGKVTHLQVPDQVMGGVKIIPLEGWNLGIMNTIADAVVLWACMQPSSTLLNVTKTGGAHAR